MRMLGLAGCSLQAQTLDENALKGMKWRQIGPFRAGGRLQSRVYQGISRHIISEPWRAAYGKRRTAASRGLPLTDKTGISPWERLP